MTIPQYRLLCGGHRDVTRQVPLTDNGAHECEAVHQQPDRRENYRCPLTGTLALGIVLDARYVLVLSHDATSKVVQHKSD